MTPYAPYCPPCSGQIRRAETENQQDMPEENGFCHGSWMGLRLGGSDRIAASARRSADEFQGKGIVTDTQLSESADVVARIFFTRRSNTARRRVVPKAVFNVALELFEKMSVIHISTHSCA